MNPASRKFWRTFVVLTLALSALALIQTETQTQALLKIRFRYKWVAVMAVFAINLGVGIFLLWRERRNEIKWEKFEFNVSNKLWALPGLILFFAAFPILWYVKFVFFGKALTSFFPWMWVWFWLALAQAAGLKMWTRSSWAVSLAFAMMIDGAIFQSWFIMQPVTDYPFSLGWSEAGRFYYASLPFSQSVYGVDLPLSTMHGTRYFLLSLPFAFGHPQLLEARLWQAILWLGITGLTAWLLIRRLRWDDLDTRWIMGGWFFLFLFQGAVYYHLLVCVIVILAGVSSRRSFGSLVSIGIASFWAGMSRLNWYPVPAALAIAIYLLEEPFLENGKGWRYFIKPALWGILGMIAAFAGQYVYIAVSGYRDVSAFGSSLASPLLWYRWWPSDTNPLGVIPGTLIVSIPLFSIFLPAMRGYWKALHPLRWLGLLGLLTVLLVGGLIVSAKIGGGGDLHNMDAYIVLLGLIFAYFSSRLVASENRKPLIVQSAPQALMAFLLIVPVGFSLSRFVPPVQYDRTQAYADLNLLRDTVQSYSRNGPVLFIYERHLLTFGLIPNVPVIPDYEVISMTEMAMSGNQPYLDNFYKDLRDHRFAAIVARKQNLEAVAGEFSEEGDVWNRLVAYPLLCEYQPILTLSSSNIQVFVPRTAPQCP